jgi:hypothetical protein
VNVVEPVIDEADAATGISINTGHLFLNTALSKDRDELIEWCKNVALNAGFSMVIEKFDKGDGDRGKLKRRSLQRTKKEIKERRHKQQGNVSVRSGCRVTFLQISNGN